MLFTPQILITIGLVSYIKFSCIRHFVHTIGLVCTVGVVATIGLVL